MKTVSIEIPAAKMSISPSLSIGFGLHWVWVYCIMFATGRVLSPAVEGLEFSPLAGFAFGVFCSICITFLAAGLFGTGFESLDRRKRAIAIATALGVAATAVRFVSLALDTYDALYAVGMAGGMLGGIATGYLLVCWGIAYRNLDSGSVALNTALGLLLAIVVYLALLALGNSLMLIVCTVLAIVGEGLLCRIAQKPLQEEAALHPFARRKERLRTYAKPSFVRFALVMLIFGFVDSILRELALSTIDAGQSLPGSLVGLFLIATGFVTLFFFVYVIMQARSSAEGTYSFATLFVVGVAVGLLFFMDTSFGFVYQFVCVVVYLLFELHVWTLLSHIAWNRHVPSSILYGFGLFFLFAGQFLSPIANGFVASLAQPLQLGSVTEPIILMLALLTAVVLLATGSARSGSLFAEDDGVAGAAADDELAHKVDTIVQRYLLTEREGEILSMLAKGRSFAKISERLYVSENTTKTHVKNIYRKTGVHSKQELMDLVDGM
ncbi:helix-turn-helix transcriptional regulator [Raoultibacter phocaeensis]|uniref:helix-turn-helix transcriptional regulator n=1 Tax=Raoultibacter phocaeensis TaxID=2479841 RepID=UPI001119050A|nr:helix-turn-helix transcriptional regulator [Raoultibacter phocaeensis]